MNAAAPGAYGYGAPGGPYPYQRLARPMHRTNFGKWIIGAAAAGFIGLVGLIVLVLLGLNYGPVALLLFAAFALFPVPILIGTAIWLSRFQPQPWSARLFALGWGATISILIAGFANDFLQNVVFGGNHTLAAVIAAPLDEESLKGIALLLIFALSRTRGILPNARKYFTGPVDGVAYALFVGAGFAFVENIQYLASAYMSGQMATGMASDGFVSLLLLFVIRCVLTPFGHPLFTSATGIALGFAARSNINIVIRVIAPVGGWLVAMMLHGFFNGSQSLLPSGLIGLILNFTIVLPPLFLIWVGVVLFLRYSQFKVVRRGLDGYVRSGWFAAPEVEQLASLKGRGAAMKWAKRVGGAEAATAMREFQYASTQLAIARDAANHGYHRSTFGEDESRLLGIIRWQQQILQRYRGVPA